MPLLKIADLQGMDPGELSSYLQWAGDLKTMYEKFVEEDDEDRKIDAGWGATHKRSGGIHASEISGECLRSAVYTLRNIERKRRASAFWLKRFHFGHMLHALVQSDLHHMFKRKYPLIEFQEEVRINPKLQALAKQYDLYSSCDGVITFFDSPGVPMLRAGMEIKTESDGQFDDLKEPRSYHREQAHLYMKVLDLPVMIYFYLNKSNSNIAPTEPPFIETFDHQLWDKLLAKIIDVREMAATNRTPERKEGMKCEFCAYSWLCNPEYLKRKKSREEARSRRNKARSRNPHRGIRAPRSI